MQMLTSLSCMTGGAPIVSSSGPITGLTFGGTRVVGDKTSVLLSDLTTGLTLLAGAGRFTGAVGTFCFTFKDKEYVLAGPLVFMSAVGDPTDFNNENEGTTAGQIRMTNKVGTAENLVSIASFQRRLVFFSRNTIQVWAIDANPLAWALEQVLQNIGSLAPASVQSIGDLDVMFLSDTGIRSLRARVAVQDAYVDDLGSPIDSLIQAAVQTSPSNAAITQGITEPTSGRYWLYLNDGTTPYIYVFSNFPSSSVKAWSRFRAIDSVGSAFVPTKFVVLNGQVVAFDKTAKKLYYYGGTAAPFNNYNRTSATQAQVQLPWLDLRSPVTFKIAKGIQADFIGGWQIKCGMSPKSGILAADVVYAATTYSFDDGIVPYNARGTHFSAELTTTAITGAAVFSGLMFNYESTEDE